MGYLASGYAPPGTVAATAVHGTAHPRRRSDQRLSLDGQHPAARVLPDARALRRPRSGRVRHLHQHPDRHGHLPRTVARTPATPFFWQTAAASSTPLPVNYTPRENDTLRHHRQAPRQPAARKSSSRTTPAASVTATYADGTRTSRHHRPQARAGRRTLRRHVLYRASARSTPTTRASSPSRPPRSRIRHCWKASATSGAAASRSSPPTTTRRPTRRAPRPSWSSARRTKSARPTWKARRRCSTATSTWPGTRTTRAIPGAPKSSADRRRLAADARR